MKIAAYQFAVTGEIQNNLTTMERAIEAASREGVRLLSFSECALTGYPPVKTVSPKEINFNLVEKCFARLRTLAKEKNIYLFVGSMLREKDLYYNSIVAIAPDGRDFAPYHKRALWGWDIDNFTEGNNKGIYDIDGLRIGVRICFEVRFPEYFRELFRAETDIIIVSFCDVAEADSLDRYKLIEAHLKTRAAENACPIISVNDISPFQTAPTAIINEDGRVMAELPRDEDKMLIYDHSAHTLSYSAEGRKTVSKRLLHEINGSRDIS